MHRALEAGVLRAPLFEEVFQVVVEGGLPLDEPVVPDGAFQQGEQDFRLSFGDVAERLAGPDQVLFGIVPRVAGVEDDRDVGGARPELIEGCETVHAGHLDVQDDGVHVVGDVLHRRDPVGTDQQRAALFQRVGQGPAHARVIIHDHDARAGRGSRLGVRGLGFGQTEVFGGPVKQVLEILGHGSPLGQVPRDSPSGWITPRRASLRAWSEQPFPKKAAGPSARARSTASSSPG